jgi:hypothetical protein
MAKEKGKAIRGGSAQGGGGSSWRGKPSLVVVVKRQTAQQERRCNAAIDALLAELVRQELGRKGKST